MSEITGTVECPHCQQKFPVRVRMWGDSSRGGEGRTGFQLAIEPLSLRLPADRKLDEFM